MDRGRAVLALGTGLIALTITGACAAPETTPATVTTAAPITTPPPKATTKPTKPAGLASVPPATKPTVKPTAQPTTRRTTTKPSVADVYYANCTEVRAAGAAPIHRGEPGYSTKLDRDGDSIACDV